jgi:V/A-type H+-transporting ATPase subunit D
VAEIKLTKGELRNQQVLLAQLEKYLPTLQLKKALLQVEVQEVRMEIQRLESLQNEKKQYVDALSGLFATQTTIDLTQAAKIKNVIKRHENIAGVDVPYFQEIDFDDFTYDLFETPPWIDSAILQLRDLVTLHQQVKIAYEQREALEKEWKEVSIRVNLFEKVLIPRALENIRVIKIFLSDQQLAAIARTKVAKAKIERNNRQKTSVIREEGDVHA